MYRGYYEFDDVIICVESDETTIFKVYVVKKKLEENTSKIIERFFDQLDEYFSGQRTEFDVSYQLKALPFRNKLYNRIAEVEYGQLEDCKTLLDYMGLSKGINVVLRATAKNPIMFIIPCHRVKNPLRRIPAYQYSNSFREKLIALESEVCNGCK